MIASILGIVLTLPLPKEELHVVSIYEPRVRIGGKNADATVQVVVDRPGKDVTLFLSAYNPSGWQVAATPLTNLKKVILGGYHKQTANVPKGVEVEELFHDGRQNKEYVYLDYKIDSERFRSSVQQVRKHTGRDLWSFQGSYHYDPLSVVAVDSVKIDERLQSDFPKLTPRDQLPEIKFSATRLVRVKNGFEGNAFGEFTRNGPEQKTLKALPKGIFQITQDTATKRYYGIAMHALHAVDLEKGFSVKIPAPAFVGEPGWLRSLAYDAKNARLVISSRNEMWEYTPKTGVWAVLLPKNGSFSALTWQASTNTLFAIGNEEHAGLPFGDDRGSPWLYELNAGGVVVAKTPLAAPMFKGVMQGGLHDRAELIDLGGDLAAVIYRENREGPGPEAFVYLIDPKTGKTKLLWKE